MNNILVTGSKGQLGSELLNISANYPQFNFIFTDSSSMNISNHQLVKNICYENKINTIINCAAYTSVDKAESEFTIADEVNHFAVKNLASIAKLLEIKLIHVSTDYVFDGTGSKPYTEVDSPNPRSVYGKTKLDGERSILSINPVDSYILRTSWLYSSFGKNFFKTILSLSSQRDQLSVVFDQVGTPTYSKDLAKVILQIVERKKIGANAEVYHFSNEGVASWYDFAVEIVTAAGSRCQIIPIESKDYPTPAPRPNFSVLNKIKIKEHLGIQIPHWRTSLEECMKIIRQNP